MLFVASVFTAISSLLWIAVVATHIDHHPIGVFINLWFMACWLALCGLYLYTACSPRPELRVPLLSQKAYKVEFA